MPKDCVDCVMQMGGWCGVSPAEVDERVAETVEDAINNGKPDWCPLVEIDAEPMRHGQLDEDKPLTNGDRIRQMTDEELFDFLDAITDTCGYLKPQCDNCQMKYKDTSPKCDIQAWLKQEVIEGDTD